MLNNIYKTVQDESTFVKLSLTTPLRAKLIEVSDPYKSSYGESIDIKFEVEGKEKTLTKQIHDRDGKLASVRFWSALDRAEVEEGDDIQIRQFGEGFDTKYEVINLTKKIGEAEDGAGEGEANEQFEEAVNEDAE